MKKIALIGDIISSKKIEDRKKVQRSLKLILEKINSENKNILSPLTITLGDEFQGLYKNSENLFKDIWFIISKIYPIKIRFSIGIGEINTAINKKQAIGMDGSAFHAAREGLQELKTEQYIFNINYNEHDLSLLKTNLFLLSHIVEPWKETRHKVFYYMINEEPVSSIARKTKISDKAVYKNINSAGLTIINKLLEELSTEINKLL